MRPRLDFTLLQSKMSPMSLLTTQAGLLQALRSGPGYGLELIRRLAQGAGVRLSEARVYPVLKQLERAGMVEAVRVAPKGRRGARARIYYHLTPQGEAAAEAQRQALLALLAPPPRPQPSPRERHQMVRRMLEAEELCRAGEELRSARER
jgi:DNA-binding PadR family transcriptional regulator